MLHYGSTIRGLGHPKAPSRGQEPVTLPTALGLAKSFLSHLQGGGSTTNVDQMWFYFLDDALSKAEAARDRLGVSLTDEEKSLCQEIVEIYTKYGGILSDLEMEDKAQECVSNVQQWLDIQELSVERVLQGLKFRRLEEQDESVYVPLQAKTNLLAPDKFSFSLMDKAKDFVASDRQVMLLLGDTGSGKSTFSRRLERNLWERYRGDRDPIPLLINLLNIDKPEQDLVSKHLRSAGFSENHFKDLKQRQLILICTGYDEACLTTNLYSFNHLNQPGQWRAKVFISCRSAAVGLDYRGRFQPQPTNRYNRSISDQFQEAVIAPFSKDQIKDYILKSSTGKKAEKSAKDGDEAMSDDHLLAEEYMERLEQLPHMLDLVKNPFLLKLSLEALPKFEVDAQDASPTRLTRAILYDKFMDHWIDAQKTRLQTTLRQDQQEVFNRLSESGSSSKDGFKEHVIKYLKNLAITIFEDKEQGRSQVVQYSNLKNQHNWKGRFFGADIETALLRDCSPLTRTGNQYRFLHRSLFEYLVSCVIYEADRSGEVAPTSQSETTLTPALVAEHPLTQRSYVDEPSILLFLAERIHVELYPYQDSCARQESPFENYLRQLIEYSKTVKSDSGIYAASNAITILVRAGHQFNRADLQGICIPGAKLVGGEFDSANFRGADLKDVDFSRTWIRNAKFEGANMDGVQFGEWPYIQLDTVLQSCASSADGELYAVGASDGSISLYDAKTWMEIRTFGPGEGVLSVAFSPSSKQIAAGSMDGSVELWNIDGSFDGTLEGHSNYVNSVAYSPDGLAIASACEDGTLLLWDVRSNEIAHTLEGHTDRALSVTFSPDGKVLVSGGSDNLIRLWNVETGAACQVLNYHTSEVTSVAFSPSVFQFASGSGDGTIQVWDAPETEMGSDIDKPGILGLFQAGVTLKGPSGEVRSIAFSPNGLQIASAFDDYILRIWDVATRIFTTALRGHSDEVLGVAYSPDGKRILSCGRDRTLRLWDARASEPGSVLFGSTVGFPMRTKLFPDLESSTAHDDGSIRLWNTYAVPLSLRLEGHSRMIESVVFSSDGTRVVTGSEDYSLKVWDTETGRNLHTLTEGGMSVSCVAYSPAGNRFASGSHDTAVRVWDSRTAGIIFTLKGHDDAVLSVCFSPAGDLLVSGDSNGTVRVWNTESGEAGYVLQGHKGAVRGVAFSPNGLLIGSDSEDGTLRLWNSSTGELGRAFTADGAAFTCIAFAPQGDQIAAACDDGTVRLFDIQTGGERLLPEGHEDEVKSVVYLSGGSQFASGCSDGTVRIWSSETGEMNVELRVSGTSIKCLAFCLRSQRLAVGCEDETVRFWSIVPSQHSSIAATTVFSPNGSQIVSIADGNSLQLWNADDGTPTRIPTDHADSIEGFALSPDGLQVATASQDGTARVWNTRTFERERVLPLPSGFVTGVVYSPNGEQAIMAGSNKSLYLWKPRTDEPGIVLQDAKGLSTNPVYSPSGQQIAVANNTLEIRLWTSSGVALSSLKGHTNTITSIAYSPNGRKIVSSSHDRTVRQWALPEVNAVTDPVVLVLTGHTNEVECVVYSPNGQLIASGSKDTTVRLWNGSDGLAIHVLTGHTGAITAVAFSPNNSFIATGSEDKSMRLWDVITGQLAARVGDFVVGVRSIGWKATLSSFFLITGCKENPLSVWKLKEEGARYDIQLYWTSGSDRLAVTGADVHNVSGLSTRNSDLLIQLKADFHTAAGDAPAPVPAP
ncbi:hypothetical protein BGX23_012797 [Mortierella sp. AD031]|nr:hypothetical protein BGX23_012797 [Mortierella sp. AD031]